MSQPEPQVSVIIPTYNHGHLIGEAVTSLQAQSFERWEAIVVNNYSLDETEAVVARFADPRIRLVNFHNGGIIAAARNHGASLSQAPLLAFLDSDDVWSPEKLAVCLEKLAQGYDLVCHAEHWVAQGGEARQVRLVRYGPEARAAYERLLFEGNCLSTSAVVMKTDVFETAGGFSEDPGMVTAEDYDLWMKVARAGARIGFIETPLGEYRLHGNNQSQATERHYRAVVSVLEKHFALHGLKGMRDKLRARRRVALAAYGCGRTLQGNTQFSDAGRWLRKSIRTWPFSLKPWAALALNTLRHRYGYRCAHSAGNQ